MVALARTDYSRHLLLRCEEEWSSRGPGGLQGHYYADADGADDADYMLLLPATTYYALLLLPLLFPRPASC